ncbi:hypothetical protein [Phytomonospora endophytica]|uniref:Uncharacterized protein n=1 Tax=Phytomonospora endophytica TaxID=714109 RepID=A0A841FRW5_9ACTN|nr:hypothetical protein [Phytomonospora endophytica]MBB6036292.1 hypothetical protein [Phytomonospora endophytica]GIG67199.1 hypothetical protein Pen01_34940 [Phytomonospora endophytica]
MSVLATRLSSVAITATSPDANIRARLRGRRLSSLELRPGAYDRYTEADLAHQLARTATLLFVARDKAAARLIEAEGLSRRRDPVDARGEAERRYLQRVLTLPVVGTGPDERVRFRAEGMARWSCRIERGTLRRLGEAEFVAETAGAAADLLRRARHETMLLRDECFGLAVPAYTRERERRAEAARRGEPGPYDGDW